ncbi:hypothetical protein DFJ77DRAFT_453274 [Powellomyces hirtus]|nr:hypothetical protein DFJ77DRAFT_453274 [Powellomyces hirtus]
MFGLNAFRSAALLVLGLAAYFFFSADKLIFRQRRAPLAQRDVRPVVTGDKIIAPGAGAQFARGGEYTISFICSVPLQYVNVDLYYVQGQTTFYKEIATNAPAPTESKGSVVVNIGKDYDTGPNYIIKVWGPVAGTNGVDQYMVPDSDHFAIVDPNAGVFHHPGAIGTDSMTLVTGRQETLNFTIGTAFDGVKNIRLDVSNSDWKDWYTIDDHIPISGASGIITYSWSVPATLRLSTRYHLRVTRSGTTKVEKSSVNVATVANSPILHSSEFTVQNAPAMGHTGMTITVNPLLYTGGTGGVSWEFVPGVEMDPIASWNVDLYNAALGHRESMGIRLATNVQNVGTGGSMQFKVPDDLSSGLYFVRVWGYSGTTTAATIDAIDPISGITKEVIVVADKTIYNAYKASVTAPTTWVLESNATFSWTYTSTLPVDGWRIDLYKKSVTYKLFKSIVVNPLPAKTLSYTVHVDDLLQYTQYQLGNDYFLYIWGNVVTSAGVTEQVGAVSNPFTIAKASVAGSDETSTSNSGSPGSSAGGKGGKGSSGSSGNMTTDFSAASMIDIHRTFVYVMCAIATVLLVIR